MNQLDFTGINQLSAKRKKYRRDCLNIALFIALVAFFNLVFEYVVTR